MKTIRLRYYAMLREDRGLDTETLQTEASTAEALFAELHAIYRFRLPRTYLKVAVNHEIRNWRTELKADDEVAFLPPFAGG